MLQGIDRVLLFVICIYYDVTRISSILFRGFKMKRIAFLFLLSLANTAIPFCCNGDGCPNTLVRYVDEYGNPTGRFALFNEFNQPVSIKKGGDCKCVAGIGTKYPSKMCPHCVEALCPRPDCGHHIFQHTCALDVRAEPGTGIIEVREEVKARELKSTP